MIAAYVTITQGRFKMATQPIIKIGPKGGQIVGYKNGNLKYPIYASTPKNKPAPVANFIDYLHHYLAPVANDPQTTSLSGEFNEKTYIQFGAPLTDEQVLDLQTLSHQFKAKIKIDPNKGGFVLFTNKKTRGRNFHPKSSKVSTLLVMPKGFDAGNILEYEGVDITSPQADGAIVSKVVNGTRFLVRVEATLGGMKYHLFAPKGSELTDVVKVYKNGGSPFKEYLGEKSGANLIKGKVVLDEPAVLTFDSHTYLMSAISEEFQMDVEIGDQEKVVSYKVFKNGPKELNGSKINLLEGKEQTDLVASVDASIKVATAYEGFFGAAKAAGTYIEYEEFAAPPTEEGAQAPEPAVQEPAEGLEAAPLPPAPPVVQYTTPDQWEAKTEEMLKKDLFDADGFIDIEKLEWLTDAPVGTEIELYDGSKVVSAVLAEDSFGFAYWEGVDSGDDVSYMIGFDSKNKVKVKETGDQIQKTPEPPKAEPKPVTPPAPVAPEPVTPAAPEPPKMVNGVPADADYIPLKDLSQYKFPSQYMTDQWAKYGFESPEHYNAYLMDTYGENGSLTNNYQKYPATINTGWPDEPFLQLNEGEMWDPSMWGVIEEVEPTQPTAPTQISPLADNFNLPKDAPLPSFDAAIKQKTSPEYVKQNGLSDELINFLLPNEDPTMVEQQMGPELYAAWIEHTYKGEGETKINVTGAGQVIKTGLPTLPFTTLLPSEMWDVKSKSIVMLPETQPTVPASQAVEPQTKSVPVDVSSVLDQPFFNQETKDLLSEMFTGMPKQVVKVLMSGLVLEEPATLIKLNGTSIQKEQQLQKLFGNVYPSVMDDVKISLQQMMAKPLEEYLKLLWGEDAPALSSVKEFTKNKELIKATALPQVTDLIKSMFLQPVLAAYAGTLPPSGALAGWMKDTDQFIQGFLGGKDITNMLVDAMESMLAIKELFPVDMNDDLSAPQPEPSVDDLPVMTTEDFIVIESDEQLQQLLSSAAAPAYKQFMEGTKIKKKAYKPSKAFKEAGVSNEGKDIELTINVNQDNETLFTLSCPEPMQLMLDSADTFGTMDVNNPIKLHHTTAKTVVTIPADTPVHFSSISSSAIALMGGSQNGDKYWGIKGGKISKNVTVIPPMDEPTMTTPEAEPAPVVAPEPEPAPVAPDPLPVVELDPQTILPEPDSVPTEPAAPVEPPKAENLMAALLEPMPELEGIKKSQVYKKMLTKLKSVMGVTKTSPEMVAFAEQLTKAQMRVSQVTKETPSAALGALEEAASLISSFQPLAGSLGEAFVMPDPDEDAQWWSKNYKSAVYGWKKKKEKAQGAVTKKHLDDVLFQQDLNGLPNMLNAFKIALGEFGKLSPEEVSGKIKDLKAVGVDLLKVIDAAIEGFEKAKPDTQWMKVASAPFKATSTTQEVLRTIRQAVVAGMQTIKKPKVPKPPAGEPVFDKFGVQYPAGTTISYTTKKVALSSPVEVLAATSPALGALSQVTISDNSALLPTSEAAQKIAEKLAVFEAFKQKKGGKISPLNFPKAPSGLSKTEQAAYDDAVDVFGDQVQIEVSSTEEVMNLETAMQYGSYDGDSLNNFETMPPSEMSGMSLIQEFVNYHLIGKPEGYLHPEGKPIIELKSPPSGDGVVMRIRVEDLNAELVDQSATGKARYAPLAEKVKQLFGSAYGAVYEQVDKQGNPTSDPVVSAGNSGVYIQFKSKTADGKSLEDVILNKSSKDVDPTLLRQSVKHTQVSLKVSVPTVLDEKEVTIASGAEGLNKNAVHWASSPFEASLAMDKKGKGYALPSDGRLVRNGFIQFYHQTVGSAPVKASSLPDSIKQQQKGQNFVMAFQPMGDLRKAVVEYFQNNAGKMQASGTVPSSMSSNVAVNMTDIGFTSDADKLTQDYKVNANHSESHFFIPTSFGGIRAAYGLVMDDPKKWNGNFDLLEFVFTDPSVAETLNHSDLLTMIDNETPELTSLLGEDLSDILLRDRTEEDDALLTALKKLKHIRGSKLMQVDKKNKSSTAYKTSDDPTAVLEGQLNSGLGLTLSPDSTPEELDEQVCLLASQAETINFENTSSFVQAELQKTGMDSAEVAVVAGLVKNEKDFRAQIKTAYEQAKLINDGAVTSGTLRIPDAHLQYASGQAGAVSSIGSCNQSPEKMAEMFGAFGEEATACPMGFLASSYRQRMGFLAGGWSEASDHENNRLSSTRIYQRVLNVGHNMDRYDGLYLDSTYLEQCNGFYTTDRYGRQGDWQDSTMKSRYSLSAHKTSDNEVLSDGEASRSISFVRAANLNVAQKTVNILKSTHGEGNKTHVWELLQAHPEIFEQYKAQLEKEEYISSGQTDLPDQGFNWDGFVGIAKVGERRAKLMTSILISIRLAEQEA